MALALMLGWYVDHDRIDKAKLHGVWYYPTPDAGVMGYWETLTIRPDGTFTKHEEGRAGSETYSGNFSSTVDGSLVFHVNKKEIVGNPDRTIKMDSVFFCRYAIDANDQLIVICPNSPGRPSNRIVKDDDCYLRWYYYTTMDFDQQSEFQKERLKAWFEGIGE